MAGEVSFCRIALFALCEFAVRVFAGGLGTCARMRDKRVLARSVRLMRSDADFPHAGAVTLIQSVKLWGSPRGRESASAYRLATQPLPPVLSLPAMLSPAPAPGRGEPCRMWGGSMHTAPPKSATIAPHSGESSPAGSPIVAGAVR